MHIGLIPAVAFAAVLFVVPVFGQDDPGTEIVMRGEVFRTIENTEVDAGALLALASAEFGPGLKANDYRNIRVAMTIGSEVITEIGLTEQRIRTRVELRLRALNLTPLPGDDQKPEYLSVVLLVAGDVVYHEISFNRHAVYFVADALATTGYTAFKTNARSWGTFVFGTHNNDPNFVLNGIEESLDTFLNQYLAANQP